MLNQHRELFAQYWRWSDDWVQHALQTGIMWTALGWTCRIGITEFNERSIRNWPIQAAGADILRIACILATRHGIKLLAPVHDAALIEAPLDRIEADVALMQEIMRRASRIVLNANPAGTHDSAPMRRSSATQSVIATRAAAPSGRGYLDYWPSR